MNIVFFVDTLGRTRHFRNVIQGLLERRHTIVFATAQRPKHHAKGLYADELVEIERAESLRKRPRPAPPRHYPLRWAFNAALAAGFDPTLSTPRR